MAGPFGKHPTLNEYLRWAEQQGCIPQSGFVQGQGGKPCSVIKMVAPSGQHLLIVGVPESERLTPSMVHHYDRRLGLQSDFPSIDPGYGHDDGVTT